MEPQRLAILAGWVLCALLAVAQPARTDDEEDPYAKANPKLGQRVKAILDLDKAVTFRPIAFGPPEIKDLKGAYFAEFRKADKLWRVLRFATDYGDYLLLEEDDKGSFKKVAPLLKCKKTGITDDDLKKLLAPVK